MTDGISTLADFKRAATPGSVWECINHAYPNVSGRRVITRGKTVLSYDYTKADGSVGRNGRMEFPKRGEATFGGSTVTFLNADGTPRFTWTLVTQS